tara:strand:+ start:534 stop:638 length:105 start_codon:yes stop_codon:yes gene_type:complete
MSFKDFSSSQKKSAIKKPAAQAIAQPPKSAPEKK